MEHYNLRAKEHAVDAAESHIHTGDPAVLNPPQHCQIHFPFFLVSFPISLYIIYSCLNIDGELRLKNDLEIKCYKGTHGIWAFGIALPALIAWGMGIPLFAFFLMHQKRKTLETVETRRKLGFLFSGYNIKFYFWEIVIMFRKIIMIFIEFFLIQYGVIT